MTPVADAELMNQLISRSERILLPSDPMITDPYFATEYNHTRQTTQRFVHSEPLILITSVRLGRLSEIANRPICLLRYQSKVSVARSPHGFPGVDYD